MAKNEKQNITDLFQILQTSTCVGARRMFEIGVGSCTRDKNFLCRVRAKTLPPVSVRVIVEYGWKENKRLDITRRERFFVSRLKKCLRSVGL